MEVDVSTWASTLAIIGAIVALYFTLGRELKTDLADLRMDLTDLKAHLVRLDDRVYALAVGMRPVVEEAASRRSKS
jgi:hypothetical protein